MSVVVIYTLIAISVSRPQKTALDPVVVKKEPGYSVSPTKGTSTNSSKGSSLKTPTKTADTKSKAVSHKSQ